MRFQFGMILLGGVLITANTACAQTRPLFRVREGLPGVDFRNVSGDPEQLPILDQNGQGVGLIDFDDDGLVDLFLPNGSTIERWRRGDNPGCRLYRNLGRWRFEDVSTKAGVRGTAWAIGCAVADYDADGNFDLYVTNWGPDTLYRNNGDGTFTDVTESSGVGADGWSSSAAFADFDGDGRLDLYVSRYVHFDPDNIPSTEADGSPCLYRGVVTGCGPWRYPGQRDVLYLQQERGRFRDVSNEWGLEVTDGFRGFGVIAADFDADRDVDVFVGCDVMPNLYLENVGGKKLAPAPPERGGTLNAQGKHESGMGVAAADLAGKGQIDLIVTNFAGETNTYYRNRGGYFDDVTPLTGLDAHRAEMGWAVVSADFDQDGRLDVFIANGQIYPQVDQIKDPEDTYAQPPRVYLGSESGPMRELPAAGAFGREVRWSLRGAAAGDLDNDGDVDLVLMQHDGPVVALENLTNAPALTVELRTPAGGRSPMGAAVMVGRQLLPLLPNQGYQSSHDHRIFLPLAGRRPPETLRVRWPDGRSEIFDVPAGRRNIILVAGQGRSAK